jgi:hypothetical protein
LQREGHVSPGKSVEMQGSRQPQRQATALIHGHNITLQRSVSARIATDN